MQRTLDLWGHIRVQNISLGLEFLCSNKDFKMVPESMIMGHQFNQFDLVSNAASGLVYLH